MRAGLRFEVEVRDRICAFHIYRSARFDHLPRHRRVFHDRARVTSRAEIFVHPVQNHLAHSGQLQMGTIVQFDAAGRLFSVAAIDAVIDNYQVLAFVGPEPSDVGLDAEL